MSKLTDYIKELNANIADVATSEKAKKLRKKLFIAGGICSVVGFLGLITCFILFATAGFGAFGDNGFTARVLVPFCLFPVFGLFAGVGTWLIRIGFSILVGGEGSKFIDKTMNHRCECGYTIKDGDLFCPNCGKVVRKTCPNCGTPQEPGAQFCKKCGTKIK